MNEFNKVNKLTEEVNVPNDVNKGLSVVSVQCLETLFGRPRRSYTAKCQPMTNEVLYSKYIVTENVGPFAVTGLRPAVTSLRSALIDISHEHPEAYEKLGTAGMLCCRYIGNSSKISNHSWGIAIDFLIDGNLDPYNNGRTYYGLALIAPILNRHGWFWGGRYRSSEDAMHFEVSKEKLLEWHNSGLLGPISSRRQEANIPETAAAKPASSSSRTRSMFDFLQKGDRGPKVVQLQAALKERDYNLKTDGIFGSKTHIALMDFQRKHGLHANGIVGPKTAAFLAFF